MKKYLLKIALFFALMAVIDVACGWAFGILRSKARGGQTHKNEYMCNVCEDDILILGSSWAVHHYVPSVFEDSLGMTCYNAGEMGCGIIPAYIRYKMVCQRKKPKLVIYEVTPGSDYLVDKSYSHYLGVIRQYANEKVASDVYFDFTDILEPIRMLSNLYCNNSKIVQNLKDALAQPDAWKGYEPLYGKLKPRRENGSKNEEKSIKTTDTLKYKYLERLILDTKKDGVPLVFTISPRFKGESNNKEFQLAFDICQKYDIPVIDNRGCDIFVGRNDLYQDYTHLNHEGAVAYSLYVIPQIRKYININ